MGLGPGITGMKRGSEALGDLQRAFYRDVEDIKGTVLQKLNRFLDLGKSLKIGGAAGVFKTRRHL